MAVAVTEAGWEVVAPCDQTDETATCLLSVGRA